ncbi:MAG: hypothetical protein ACRDMV_25080 [Streptosporangiales bacterium]
MAGKLGRLPPHPESTHPRLKLGRYLTSALPEPPVSVDWYSQVTDWPMYGNDDWGDCVLAAIGHEIESRTHYGQGQTVEIPPQAVLDAYTAVTGFDPDAGPPGQNPTDRGTNMQDALGYWRHTGVGGHTILVFAQVDEENQIRQAVNLFGAVGLGITVTRDMMDDFDAGKPWTRASGQRLGGHAVPAVGYDDQYVYVVSWARIQPMTWACFRQCVEECWCSVTRDWLDSSGQDPQGLDLAKLGDDFTNLTGQPAPVPQPTPTPTPPPDPKPGGCLPVVSLGLTAVARRLARKAH